MGSNFTYYSNACLTPLHIGNTNANNNNNNERGDRLITTPSWDIDLFGSPFCNIK